MIDPLLFEIVEDEAVGPVAYITPESHFEETGALSDEHFEEEVPEYEEALKNWSSLMESSFECLMVDATKENMVKDLEAAGCKRTAAFTDFVKNF